MNTNPGAPVPRSVKVNSVDIQLSDITNILNDNISKSISNSENLHILEEKTSQLKNDSKIFYKESNSVKKKMRIKNMKCFGIIVTVVVIIIIILLI